MTNSFVLKNKNTLSLNTSIGLTDKESNAKILRVDNKILSYNFNTNMVNIWQGPSAPIVPSNSVILGLNENWYLPENLNKLLGAFFKSIYCLISKPKIFNSPDKLVIEILYYISIPDQNIFKWYNFIYNNKNYNNNKISGGVLPRNIQRNINKIRRKKLIKTIFNKNFNIKRTLFNLNNSNIAKLFNNKFTILFKFLSSKFRKPIIFNLIRLHKSDYDSNILAQLFVLIIKKKNIRIAINKLYNKNNINNININIPNKEYKYIPAIISGLYIHIGGRLMREPIIPRLTTKKFEMGAIATGKVNFLDSARITKKNKKGAYTIRIAYAQNLVR